MPCPAFHSQFTATSHGLRAKYDRGWSAKKTGFAGPDYDFSRSAPRERSRKRLPIIINGASSAGLVLAIGLQNARIPFEICEQNSHDLRSRLRRNHASMLERNLLLLLKKFLGLQNYEPMFQKIMPKPLDSQRDNLPRIPIYI